MNEFKEKLKVQLGKADIIEKNLPYNYVKGINYIDKIADNVYAAILDTKPENEQEKLKQIDLLHNINKFIYEYEEDAELRKILADYEYLKRYRKIQPKIRED